MQKARLERMLRCDECGMLIDDNLKKYIEPHGEETYCCPHCDGTEFTEVHLCKGCEAEYITNEEVVCKDCLEVINDYVDRLFVVLFAEFPNVDKGEIYDLVALRLASVDITEERKKKNG